MNSRRPITRSPRRHARAQRRNGKSKRPRRFPDDGNTCTRHRTASGHHPPACAKDAMSASTSAWSGPLQRAFARGPLA
jgi:hypothetical protein